MAHCDNLIVCTLPHPYQWKSLLSAGTSCANDALKQRVAMLSPNKCCTIIYTVRARCIRTDVPPLCLTVVPLCLTVAPLCLTVVPLCLTVVHFSGRGDVCVCACVCESITPSPFHPLPTLSLLPTHPSSPPHTLIPPPHTVRDFRKGKWSHD